MELLARGNLRKLDTRLETPVSYRLPTHSEATGLQLTPLNDLLGKGVQLRFTGQINCVHCNRVTKKSFSQGYCYPCFQSLAQCDSCIIHPERCHFDQGTCREPAWGEEFCMRDHIVYLANSSGAKVGITRSTQVPTRWIDQGAVQALPIVRVRSRLQSGVFEVLLRRYVTDKTNWRDMLRGGNEPVDLIAERERLLALCAPDLEELIKRFGFHAINPITGVEPIDITYPVLSYPEKISTLSFDKDPLVEDTLMGIKGQYLIFENGVINIRRFAGYEIEASRL